MNRKVVIQKALGLILVLGGLLMAMSVAQANHTPVFNQSAANEPVVTAKGHGIVQAIDESRHQLLINHAGILTLHWPAMKEQFQVAKDVPINQLKVNDKIEFVLQKNEEGSYTITQIKVDAQ